MKSVGTLKVQFECYRVSSIPISGKKCLHNENSGFKGTQNSRIGGCWQNTHLHSEGNA